MRKIGNEGSLRSRDRCNEPWIVDGTPINYSSHIKNHSDLFFTWPSPPPSPVSWTTRMDRGFFWISFIGFKTRFDSKIQIIWKWIYEIDLSNIYQVLKYLWRISPSKTRFPFRGDFIILLVEIKLEMKLDKLYSGYEKSRDYVSSLEWRMYFFFVPGKPILHEEFSNQEHSSSSGRSRMV